MHMNGCGLLLSKQFPELHALQKTVYSQNISKLQPAKDFSLFFHFYSAHWVLSHFREGHVYLYDSLQCKTLHPNLKEQMVALYGDATEVEVIPVQVQVGTQDCGCFAIAFSVSLMFGDNPSSLVYKQKELRQHMADCITEQHWTPFPASERRAKKMQPVVKLSLK